MRVLRNLRSEAGYTMAEMLVVTAVISLIMGGLLTLLTSGQQTYLVGSNRAEAQQTARLVLYRLAAEVRSGGYDPKNTATFAAITALTPPNVGFTIWNDWSADGAIETNTTTLVNGTARGEQITWDYTGTSLRRRESQIDANPVTVANTVSAITFQYLDADDVPVGTPHLTASAINIRTVVVTVTTTPDTQATSTSGQVSVTSTLRARVRNRL
jgi:prepilin-type N-terminal cleavage/methylation domain-containing protein